MTNYDTIKSQSSTPGNMGGAAFPACLRRHTNRILRNYIHTRDSKPSTPTGGVPVLNATLGGAAYIGSTRNRGAPVLDRHLKDGSGEPDLDHQMWERQTVHGGTTPFKAPLKSLRAPKQQLLLLLRLLLKGKLLLKLLLRWLLLLSCVVSSSSLSWLSLFKVVVSVVSVRAWWRSRRGSRCRSRPALVAPSPLYGAATYLNRRPLTRLGRQTSGQGWPRPHLPTDRRLCHTSTTRHNPKSGNRFV